MEFNNLFKHDTVIRKIEIDKSESGKNDKVIIEIEQYDSIISKVVFKEIYWANLELNFGVVASDGVDVAFIAEKDDEDLAKLNSKWRGLISDIELKCYVIKTSSTGSEIKIISKGFIVL